MKQTPNLLLKLPEPTDFVLVEDLNENFTKIDTEVAKITNQETGVEAKLTKHLDDFELHTPYAITTSGAAGVYNVDLGSSVTELYEGLSFAIKIHKTNTTYMKLNVNSLGDKWIQTQTVGLPEVGTLLESIVYTLRYNGVHFILQGFTPLNNTLTSASSTEAATANAVKMVNDKFTPENWIGAVLSMGTQDPTTPISYFKDSFGIVHIQGTCKVDSAGMLGFTLPVGYRPSVNMQVVILQSTNPQGLKFLSMQKNGYMYSSGFTASAYAAINISYRAGA